MSVAMGVLPVGVPTIYEQFPDWFRTVMNSGISAGCLTAIVLNLLFNHLPSKAAPETVALPTGGGEEPVGDVPGKKPTEEIV